MSHKMVTSAVFLVSALACQHSWADVFEGCSDPKFKAAHVALCTDGLGLPKQPAGWGNNGEAKKQTAETVASNKAKLVCHQKFSKPADAAKLKDCLQNAADLAP